MTDFDRDDIVHNKKIKLAVLAVVFVATIIAVVLDCMDFIGKWG